MKLTCLFMWEKQLSDKSNVSSILLASGIIIYLFCTVAPHCNWLSYQRDQLRISQSTNTWIKEFLSQIPESRSFFRPQITGEMPRISRCACGVPCSLPPWRPSMKPLIAPPAPFDETIDRDSGPTCSLFPRWRPLVKPSIVSHCPLSSSMKPSIGTVVLHL